MRNRPIPELQAKSPGQARLQQPTRRSVVKRLLFSALLVDVLGLTGTIWPLGRPDSPVLTAKSVDGLIEAIDSRYRDVRTLKTEFTQTYVWGDSTRKESGTAYFARGGLMRWEYREPKDKLVIADGKKMWLYIPQEKQVTQSSFKPEDDPRVPFPLLLSHF